jgi:RNA polymerase sigma-70 factor, ECF subfamily
MDPQHPNSRRERGLEALRSSSLAHVVNGHLVAAALGRLTQEHRDVLRECYLHGSSVAQAANALGIAPGTVKYRTYYALHALRLAIEELRDIE